MLAVARDRDCHRSAPVGLAGARAQAPARNVTDPTERRAQRSRRSRASGAMPLESGAGRTMRIEPRRLAEGHKVPIIPADIAVPRIHAHQTWDCGCGIGCMPHEPVSYATKLEKP